MEEAKPNRLTFLEEAGKNKHGQKLWLCQCECGKQHVAIAHRVIHNMTRSCGCLRSENAKKLFTKHGKCTTPEYVIWTGMIQRCENPNSSSSENYSERGIVVCDRWRVSFENFLADMGERPKGATLERVDNDGPYSPDNCVWSLKRKEQTRNRRNTVMVTVDGITKPLAEWAEEVGLPCNTVYLRIFFRGWSAEEALTTPLKAVKVHDRELDEELVMKSKARRSVYLALRAGKLTRPETCSYPGCDCPKVDAHHHNGYDEEHALDIVWVCRKHHPKPNEILVTANGETKTVREWSVSTGIAQATIRSRLKSGWTPEEAVTFPVGHQKNKPGRKPGDAWIGRQQHLINHQSPDGSCG